MCTGQMLKCNYVALYCVLPYIAACVDVSGTVFSGPFMVYIKNLEDAVLFQPTSHKFYSILSRSLFRITTLKECCHLSMFSRSSGDPGQTDP